jgi:hypothetical protein
VKELNVPPKLYPVVQPVDNSDLDPSHDGIKKEISITHGYSYEESETKGSKNTWETHIDVSGKYGFSEISSITATIGGSLSGETISSITKTKTFQVSRTQKTTYNFPAGICTGYYVWGIELDGRTLFLGELKSLENPTLAGLHGAVEELERHAEPMIVVTGTPLPEANPGMPEARRRFLQKLLSDGKRNILSYLVSSTYKNDAMICYWNDWDKRDKNASQVHTYMFGRFSIEVSGYILRPWNNGKWFCHMTRDGAIASGTELDTDCKTCF